MTKIITNHQPRALVPLTDVPKKARADFDYVEGPYVHEDRFFKYKGRWYDACEFVQGDSEIFAGWDGFASDSFFSGTVIRCVDDYHVVVGTFYC